MLVAVVVIYTICTAPILLFDFWETMGMMLSKVAERNSNAQTINTLLTLLAFLNYIVNVFIYYWTSE